MPSVSLIDSAAFTKVAPDSPGPTGGGAGSAAILPEPDLLTTMTFSGDVGAEIAALAVKSGEKQQHTAQTQRDAQMRVEVDSDNAQVDAMNKKAEDIRSAGWAEGLGMAAEGAFTLASSTEFVPTKDGGFTLTPEGHALQAEGKLWNAGATLGSGSAKALGAGEDANAEKAKATSDLAKAAAEDAHDARKGADDFVSAAIDFYKEYTSAQSSAKSAAMFHA